MISRASLLKEIMGKPSKLIGLLTRDPKLLKYLLSDAGLKQKYCKLPDDIELEMKEAVGRLGLSEAEFIALGVIHLLGEVRR